MHGHLTLNKLQCITVAAVWRLLEGNLKENLFLLQKMSFDCKVEDGRMTSRFPSLFHLCPRWTILQGCCLSLATFSLRKCCIRQPANRVDTQLEYRRRQRQKNQHRPLWGYTVTLHCFYLLPFLHFHFPALSWGEKKMNLGKKKRETGWSPCHLWFQSDDTISTTGRG